jgi:hypothetical protein
MNVFVVSPSWFKMIMIITMPYWKNHILQQRVVVLIWHFICASREKLTRGRPHYFGIWILNITI